MSGGADNAFAKIFDTTATKNTYSSGIPVSEPAIDI